MRFIKNYKIYLLLLAAFLLLGYKVRKPFIGHHDWNAVFFGNIAKNTAKFGFLKTKFGAVYTFLPQQDSEFEFHTHQPPVLHLLLGLQAKLIGVHEWSMRLIPIGFSLLSVYFFFKISQLLFGQQAAFAAGLFFIFNPMFIYFGKLVVHEPLGLGVVAYSLYRYLIFFKKTDKKNLFWLGLSVIFACQTVWSGYYLAPLYIAHFWFFRPGKIKKSRILYLIIIPFASFFAHLLHIFVLTGGWDIGLFKTMAFRMQIGSKAKMHQFTLIEYIKQEGLWLSVYFTRVLCVLNAIYFLFLIKKIIKRKASFKDGFLLMLVVFGLIDPVIFRNLCFIHDYKLIYFIFAIPLIAVIALNSLKEKFDFFWRRNYLITTILFYLIFALFATERLEFTKTLLSTSFNKPAYDLGLTLQEKSKEGEIVLIGSESFAEFLDIFLRFYGQRKLVYFKPKLNDFNILDKNKARLAVFIKGREEPSQDLLNFLQKNFSSFRTKDFLFFDLNTKR